MKPTPSGGDKSSKAALVVAAHGRRGILAGGDGARMPFMIRGRHLRAVCGDRVFFEHTTAGEAVLITGIDRRENELQRLSGRGGLPETIAANVTHLVVVMAALPAPDLFLTDRYLCAARLMGAASAICWNKSDLAGLPSAELAGYTTLGYPVWPVSAAKGTGITPLRTWIGQGIAILVGQSGVGKSSLLNALVPGISVETGELSLASDEGRHTTTASVLHSLPGGGCLLDTPGVRDFVPAIPAGTAVSRGFVEIEEYGRQCRFTDCSHLRESHCAVQQAVSAGLIAPRRFESYRRLKNLMRQADGRSG